MYFEYTTSGAHHTKLVEPNTISEEYEIVWRRPQIDSEELLYLKLKKNYSYKQLAAHFGRSVNTIDWHLRRLRAENKI